MDCIAPNRNGFASDFVLICSINMVKRKKLCEASGKCVVYDKVFDERFTT